MTFSPPSIDPLSRLQVSRGLLITTERWQHAQTYHRQRQNLHYQSLHQPGIVRGLGVSTIQAPATAKRQERNYLWVQISPGIAIDLKGNPIILSTALNFGIDPSKLDPMQGNLQTVYLVAQYVDPEQDHNIDFQSDSQTEFSGLLPEDRVSERCRIVQRSFAEIQPDDVELCRIRLNRNSPQLHPASSIYFSDENTLDLRDRLIAKPRPQGMIGVTQIDTDTPVAASVQAGLEGLLQSTTSLFPALQGNPSLSKFSPEQLNDPASNDPASIVPASVHQDAERKKTDLVLQQLTKTALIYLSFPHLRSFTTTGKERLRRYLEQGGVILIEAAPQIQPLENIREELSVALADWEMEIEPGQEEEEVDEELRSNLQSCIDRVNARISETIDTICTQVETFAYQVNYPLQGEGFIPADHPIRTSPFTFSTWPQAHSESVRLFCWDGIVLVLGTLSSLWTNNTSLPRQDIRTAQELGINLLHYAWKHHHLIQLQQGGIRNE